MRLPSFNFVTSFFTAPEPSAEEQLLAQTNSTQERAHLYQRMHAHEELPFLVKAASWMLTGKTVARAANPNNPNEQWIVDNTVAMAEKLGVDHVPGIFIVESNVPNAASLDGDHMIITRGLLDAMPQDQVTAVIGHELAHHRHSSRDRVGMIGSYIGGLTVGLLATIGVKAKMGRTDIGLGTGVLAGYITGSFAKSAHSRSMEYESDLEAALATSPETMQAALKSLEAKVDELKAEAQQKDGKAKGNSILRKVVNFIRSPFATHPSTENRIARLEKLKQDPERQAELLAEINPELAEDKQPSHAPHSKVSDISGETRVQTAAAREIA